MCIFFTYTYHVAILRRMERISLEKPDFSSIDKAKFLEKMEKAEAGSIASYISKTTEPQYLYWDKVRYKTPPKDFSPLEGWYMTKQMRKFYMKVTPLLTEKGQPFVFYRRECDDEQLHKIDMLLGNHPLTTRSSLVEQNRQKFLRRGLVEEAIASSQIEGAATTRPVAKKMILENRAPRNRSEIMIVNNYKAMRVLEEDYVLQPLSIDMLFELHRILTKDDPEIESAHRGRLRKDSDEIEVHNKGKQKIAHIPPKEIFLNTEMERLIAYANDEGKTSFTHPIVKAIFLHFWIGYLHPFTDGNGRTARALFYWYLLRHGYPSILYLPISTVIKKSSDQYAQAYIYSEQDDNDLTYFFDYNLRKILQAVEEFEQYIDRIVKRNKEVDAIVEKDVIINDRQKQILHYLKSEGTTAYTTVQAHMSANGISRITAMKDLKELEKLGYLSSNKIGTYRRYYLTDKLKANIVNN